jgi:hypothetical protein
VVGVGGRVAHAARAQRTIGAEQPSRASAERESEREAREYMDGTGRRNRREREVRVWGAHIARSAETKKRKKFRNLRQTQVSEQILLRRITRSNPLTDTGSSLYHSSLKWSLSRSVLFFSVQYWRPNGWADRDQHWHKHALGLCDEDSGVDDRECALMRAQCAKMRAQHYISSIDGQTTGPIEPQIGTNTHWDNG